MNAHTYATNNNNNNNKEVINLKVGGLGRNWKEGTLEGRGGIGKNEKNVIIFLF